MAIKPRMDEIVKSKKVCMKNLLFLILCLPLLLHAKEDNTLKEQISLEGLLDLCRKASNPEELEKSLNDSGSAIHNIDLNDDGNIDYLNVEEAVEENIHMLFIRSEVNNNEFQDIAVIEVEKAGESLAYVRAVADSALFGEELAIEPKDEKELNSGGKGGPYFMEVPVKLLRANCWSWPMVRALYLPGYRPWMSPWRLKRLPPWYKPWKPMPPAVFRPRLLPPMAYYKPFPYRRAALAHKLYKMHRRQAKLARMHHRMNKAQRGHGGRGGRGGARKGRGMK